MKTDSQNLAKIHVAGRALAFLVVMGLAVHIFLPQVASLERSFLVVRQMAIWAVLLAILAQVLSYLGAGYLLQSIVRLSNRSLTLIKATLIATAAYSLGMAAGGLLGAAAATYRWVQKEGASSEIASLASTIPGYFNSSVLLLVSSAGMIHLLAVHELNHTQVFGFTLILAALVAATAILAWGYRHRLALQERTHQLGKRISRLLKREYNPDSTDNWLNGLFEAWELMLGGGWRGPALGAGLNVLFDMLTLYFLFVAAGNPISPGILLAGYGLPLLLGRAAFFIPGGLGVVEGTMVALYSGMGVPNSVAVVVVLAYRLLSFWMPLALGFFLIGIVEKNSSTKLDNAGNL